MNFLHGVEVIELDGGARPIQGVSSSIIGLVGTASKGPVNQPVLIGGSRKKALDIFGAPDGVSTLPDALDGIFDQTGAIVVVVNVAEREEQTDVTVTLVDGKAVISELQDAKENDRYFIPVISSIVYETDGGQKENLILNEHVSYDVNSHELSLVKNSDKEIPANATLTVSYELADPETVTDADYQTGIQALLAAENEVHVAPRILVAPGRSHQKAVADELVQVAERLRAIAIAECPETDDENNPHKAAMEYRKDFGSARLYLIDPAVKVYDGATDSVQTQPASARIAGVIAKSDTERGFWYSPSNRPIAGINATARAIDFALGDRASSANRLNEQDVATIIRQDGYRLWGNRSCSADPKWQFISVRRTADLINDALQRAHMWAVDRNITKTYVEDVTEGVNAYLRHLKAIGAIINGKCWADPALNTPDQIMQGKVTFDFDFVPPYPAEHITFRSSLNNKYLEEVFA